MVGLHAGLLVFLGSAGNLYAATRTATGIGGLTASKRDFNKGSLGAKYQQMFRGTAVFAWVWLHHDSFWTHRFWGYLV